MFLGTPRGYKGVDDLAAAVASARAAGRGPGRWSGADPDARAGAAAALGVPGHPPGRPRPVRRGPGATSRRPTWSPCPSGRRSDTRGQVPAKLFDAMALGRPIVSTRVSMIPEILEGCGLLVAAGRRGRRWPHAIGRLLDRSRRGGGAGRGAPASGAVERYSFAVRAARALPADRAGHGGWRADEARRHLPAVLLPRRRRDRHRRPARRARPRAATTSSSSARAGSPVPGVGVRRAAALPASPPCSACSRFALAARAAAARHGYDIVQSHERCLAPGSSIARARAAIAAYLEAMGRTAAGSIRTTGSSWPSSGGSSRSEPRATWWRSRGRARRRSSGATAPTGVGVTLVYNGVDLEPLPSRQPRPPPPPDARGAGHSRGRVDRALRGLGLRAQGPRTR